MHGPELPGAAISTAGPVHDKQPLVPAAEQVRHDPSQA